MCMKKGKLPSMHLMDTQKYRHVATGVGQCAYDAEKEGAKRDARVKGTIDAEHPRYIGPTHSG